MSPIVGIVVPLVSVSDSEGPTGPLRAMLLVNLVLNLVGVGGMSLVIAGIARLATPPTRIDPREPG